MWNAQLMTLGHSLYLKVINLSHIHQIKLIKWVVQTRVLLPEILRNVTLVGIDFATADLQVNNCHSPSLASLPLPMTSHASVNDTQLEQQREVWNRSLFPHFSNKVNLQFLCETNKNVLCLGINKILKCRGKSHHSLYCFIDINKRVFVYKDQFRKCKNI